MSLHSMSEADKTDKFNYSYLFDNFKKALIEDEDIDLEHYLIGYKELCKFCYLLGKGFGFIGAEIESKIKTLESFQCGDNKEHFRTIKEMIHYELSSNLLEKPDYVSGCRTLLRLHRGLALAFCNFSNIQKTRREILQAHTFPRNFSSRFMKLNSILEQNLSQLKSKIDGQSCLPNFKVELSSTIANVFFVYFCNKSFDTSESRFQEMIRNYDSVFYEVNQGYASDFLPWLTYFQSSSHKRNLQEMSKSIRAFFMECLIKERIDKLNSSPKANDDEEEDYVDSLMNSVYNTDEEVNIPLDTALFSLEDIIGGHSAISNFILKTLGFLVNNPEVQAKIQKEIDVITSNERSVSLSDRKKMPYTEATILESIRMIASPIVPHVATQDSSIGGFEVQKDTLIFLNNYELSMSPDLWSEPERFQPERFINTEGRIVKPEYFLPFSGGRRSCMGKKMVQLVSFMTVASLFQSYGLNKVTGHEYKVPIGDLALPYETFQFKFEPRRPRDI